MSLRSCEMTRHCQMQDEPFARTCRVIKSARKLRTTSLRLVRSTGNLGKPPLIGKVNKFKIIPNESFGLLDVQQEFESTRKRWVALGLFCLVACSQCCIWNTWGPIAGSAIIAFPTWHKSLVALLSNWGCITYLTCCFSCCWLLHRKGLLTSIRVAATLSTLATFIRCISSQEIFFTIAVHIAAILNGLSGVIIGPATALVSAVWFPRGERTTATGISAAFNQLGMAASYLIGPAVVGTPLLNSSIYNTRSNLNAAERTTDLRKKRIFRSTKQIATFPNVHNVEASAVPMALLRVQIMSLMRIEFVAQLLVLAGVLWFFPKKSADSLGTSGLSSSRFGILDSVLHLFWNKNIWQLCLAAALSQGVTGPWLAMITMTFGSTINQSEADKLAFWTIIFSSILSLTTSRVMDIFQGHLKIAIYTLLVISSAMFLWILLLDNQILSFDKDELYTAVILGISASWSTPALFLELASEIAFPVSEAIVGGFMIFLANVIGAIFYFSFFLPGMGEHWFSYIVFGNLTVASILVMYVKDEYNRTKMDISNTTRPRYLSNSERCWILRELWQQNVRKGECCRKHKRDRKRKKSRLK